MVSCILLAAGYSSRFGSPKALAQWQGRTVIEQIQEALIASILDEIIVVLGASAEEIKPYLLKHKKIKVVYNKDYNLGQTSSFKAGLNGLSEQNEGIMLLPVDFPSIQTATINLLVEQFDRQKPLILIPTCRNHKGHPPVFHRTLIKEFYDLEDGEGLNTVSRRHAEGLRLCAVPDEGVLLSFNTREDFAEISKQLFRRTGG